MEKKYTVFVSSTYEDLKLEREAVVKALLEMGHIPVGMEMFSAADETQWKLIQRNIDLTDYYIVIIAHRYGSMDGAVSFTEKEYDYAIERAIPILGLIIDPGAAWSPERIERRKVAKLNAFKEKVRRKTVAFWLNAEDLARKAVLALGKQIPVTPRPGWIRGTDVPGADLMDEFTRLSRENSELRDRVRDEQASVLRFDIVRARFSAIKKSSSIRLLITPTSSLPTMLARHLTRCELIWHKLLLEAASVRFESASPNIQCGIDGVLISSPGELTLESAWETTPGEVHGMHELTMLVSLGVAGVGLVYNLKCILTFESGGRGDPAWVYENRGLVK